LPFLPNEFGGHYKKLNLNSNMQIRHNLNKIIKKTFPVSFVIIIFIFFIFRTTKGIFNFEQVIIIRYNLVWDSLRSINLDFNYNYFMGLFEFVVGEWICYIMAMTLL
jgi:hypothetical protein